MTEVKKHLGEEKAKQTLDICTASPYSTLFAQTIIFQVPLCLDTWLSLCLHQNQRYNTARHILNLRHGHDVFETVFSGEFLHSFEMAKHHPLSLFSKATKLETSSSFFTPFSWPFLSNHLPLFTKLPHLSSNPYCTTYPTNLK